MIGKSPLSKGCFATLFTTLVGLVGILGSLFAQPYNDNCFVIHHLAASVV